MVTLDDLYKDVIKHPMNMSVFGEKDIITNLLIAMNTQQMIELGVQTGQSTIIFLKALQSTGGKLWSCDVDPLHGRIATIDPQPNWTFTKGNDLDTVVDAPEDCDVIFIDTFHQYEHTIKEIKAYKKHLKPGGIFLLHDTWNPEFYGVTMAIGYFLQYYKGSHFYNFEQNYGLGVFSLGDFPESIKPFLVETKKYMGLHSF